MHSAAMASLDSRNSEDAMKVLGRVADAFDNPALHKMDKELLLVVNVVKSRQLLTGFASEESMCCDSSYDFSDMGGDEDVELVELGDASVWEHTRSYPYVSRRHGSQGPRTMSEHGFRQDDGTYDINKMLLTSSPLDRLDRLARMELKKTGWFERADRWTAVEMGLQAVPLPAAPPETPSKQAPVRPEADATKASTPWSVRSQDSDFDSLGDFSTLCYTDAARCRDSRGGGRLGEVVRRIVRRILPPTPRTGRTSGTGHYGTRSGKGSRQGEMTGSGWTFRSAGGQGSLNRWSGFWHDFV